MLNLSILPLHCSTRTLRLKARRGLLMSSSDLTSFSHKFKRLPHSIKVCLDFDGTITEKDTLHLLADVAYGVQARHQGLHHLPMWQAIVEAYLYDYEEHLKAYRPVKQHRFSLKQEIEWLRSLQPIEQASAQRALEAGIFKNVHPADMVNGATEALRDSRVNVRKGYTEFMSYISTCNRKAVDFGQRPISVSVLSVNWSAAFVLTVVIQASNIDADDPIWIDNLKVYANEIPSIEAPKPNHQHSDAIRTSGDKIQRFEAIVSEADTTYERTVYVGDSTTDLECLLAAHTGICIRDHKMGSSQQELANTCERIGIAVKHIEEKPNLEKSSNVLWWAHDFVAIQTWLESIDVG